MNTPRNGNGKEPEPLKEYVVHVYLNEKLNGIETLAFPQPSLKAALAFAADAAKQPVLMRINPDVALVIPIHRISHVVMEPLVTQEEEAEPAPKDVPKIEVVGRRTN